jgi:hypothetical protein
MTEPMPDWLPGNLLTSARLWLSLAGLVVDRLAADGGPETVAFSREALACGHPRAVECFVRLGVTELALWRTPANARLCVLRVMALQVSPDARRAYLIACRETLKRWE